jgi:hypothetical protein
LASAGDGQEQFNQGPSLGVVVRLDPPAMGQGDLLNDGKPQATASAQTAHAGWISPVEALEHVLQIGLTEPRTLILNLYPAPVAALGKANFDLAAIGAEAKGIVQQIEQGPVQAGFITDNDCGRSICQRLKQAQADAPCFG